MTSIIKNQVSFYGIQLLHEKGDVYKEIGVACCSKQTSVQIERQHTHLAFFTNHVT